MTLTDTAYWARAIIKYGLTFLIFIVIARFVWNISFGIYRHFSPEPPPAPTVTFGKLPALATPVGEKPKEGQTLNFILELPESDLPITPTVYSVFVVPPKSAFLGALDEARKLAERLRFNKNEEAVSEALYRFGHERTDSVLEINIITGAFSISSTLYKEPDLVTLTAPGKEIAATTARSYLSNANIFPEDFTTGATAATYLKTEGEILVPAISSSEGSFTKVDLFRQDVNELPVVTPTPGQANVWFVVSGTSDPARSIIGGEYHYFAIDESSSSTYPLKTANQAWDDLKAGRGIFISLPDTNSIVVRRAYLAYYDSRQFQGFFQPIFVFEGDGGFVGYVPAVTNEYYSVSESSGE